MSQLPAETMSVRDVIAKSLVSRRLELGLLPLLLSCPFMYFPRILEGDTQPWVLLAALIALFTFRTDRFVLKKDLSLVCLSLLAVLVYAVRGGSGADLVRVVYTQAMFICLWLVCSRDKFGFMLSAVRLTVVVWFVVGMYQYLFIAFGWPVEIAGRYIEGRSGVPSIASEPSTYGCLSILHMMSLISENRARNTPYIAAAAVSVVLSGSLLGLLLLVFPLLKLNVKWRLFALLSVPLLIIGDYSMTSAGVASRVSGMASFGDGIMRLALDPSLNLRAGHIYFTLWANFWSSVLMMAPVDFMNQYNAFAGGSVVFVPTGSNFILSGVGDMIYSFGAIGALLLVLFIKKSQERLATPVKKIIDVGFMLACVLNPIYLSNVFLVLYARQKK